MTLSIKETGVVYKCGNCKVKTVATGHNGMIIVRAGKQMVWSPTLSTTCPGCGHLNHVSAMDEADVVR